MDGTVFETSLLAEIIKKLLQNFNEWNTKSSLKKAKYKHVDVTLSKDGTIQVTNYGQSTNDILHFSSKVFSDVMSTGLISDNSLLATVYSRNECSDCQETLDLRFVQNGFILTPNTNDKDLIRFAHQKKYLSFELKHKLIFYDSERLTKIILNEISLLQRLSPRTKFTYHCDQKVVYKNHVPLDNDYKSCQVLVTALTNIVKHSVNVEFKENCFSMLKVDSSHQVKDALMIKLLPLIHDNYTFTEDT